MRSQRQRQIRPGLVLAGVLILGGCTSAIVREIELIHRLVIPSSPGDGSVIATGSIPARDTLHSARADRAHAHPDAVHAIVPEGFDPNDP